MEICSVIQFTANYLYIPITGMVIVAPGVVFSTVTRCVTEMVNRARFILPVERSHVLESLEHVFTGVAAAFGFYRIESFVKILAVVRKV